MNFLCIKLEAFANFDDKIAHIFFTSKAVLRIYNGIIDVSPSNRTALLIIIIISRNFVFTSLYNELINFVE